MKAAFIVSTGRTGTDWFTTLFNEAVENAWSLHEPWPAFRSKARKLIGHPFSRWHKYYFKLPRVWRHLKVPEKWYVETNYHLFAAIPLLRACFRGALVVHIVRDGREVVTSWLNRYRYITNDHIVPFNIPGDPAQKQWHRWNPLQKLSWYWKTVNHRIKETGADVTVRFDEVFQGPRRGAFEILNRMDGISYDKGKVLALLDKKVNRGAIEFFPRYKHWFPEWKRQFWEIAGEEMEEYGWPESECFSG